jgi:hypothetical protein
MFGFGSGVLARLLSTGGCGEKKKQEDCKERFHIPILNEWCERLVLPSLERQNHNGRNVSLWVNGLPGNGGDAKS